MEYQEKPDITLKDIIKDGFIKSNISVYASINEKISGIINNEGAIEIKIDGVKKVFPFPSGAAREFTKTSVNGWKFWKIDYNNELIELAELKRKYLNK